MFSCYYFPWGKKILKNHSSFIPPSVCSGWTEALYMYISFPVPSSLAFCSQYTQKSSRTVAIIVNRFPCVPLIKWMIGRDLSVTLSTLPLLLHHAGSNYWMYFSYVGNTEYIYNCILSRLVLRWDYLHYLLRDYTKEIYFSACCCPITKYMTMKKRMTGLRSWRDKLHRN